MGRQQPPGPRVYADEGLAGCFEEHDGQLEEHTCRFGFGNTKSKCEALAYIEDYVRTALLLV